MSHKTAIMFVGGAIGLVVLLTIIMDFMENQFGLWFSLPLSIVVIGFVYWVGYHSSEQSMKEDKE